MKFTSPSRLLSLLNKRSIEFWYAYGEDANKKRLANGTYGGAQQKPEYAWVNLIEKEDKIQVNLLMPIAWCRGWCYEALFASLKRSRGIKTAYYEEVNIHNDPLTILCMRGSNQGGLEQGIKFLNELEIKAGWSKTVLYKHPTLGGIHLIIGSKRWKYNIPLLSAFLLIPRITSLVSAHVGESLEDYTKRLEQGHNLNWGYGSDTYALLKAMKDDLLLKMMKHHRSISGKPRYTHLHTQKTACVHGTGIGDLSDRAHILLSELREDNTLNSDKKQLAKIKELNNKKYFPNDDTLKVHKEIIEKIVLKIYKDELKNKRSDNNQ